MSTNTARLHIEDVTHIAEYLHALLKAGINVPNAVRAASNRLMREKITTGAAIERAERASNNAIVTAEIEAMLPDSLGG